MAVQIEVVATTRDGKRLSSRLIDADIYQHATKEITKAFNTLTKLYKDPSGVTPYIFTHTTYKNK